MKHLFFSLLICSVSLNTLSAQDHNRNSVNSSDKKFITEAAESGLAEVQLGQIGQAQANAERVKEFARMMVQDHNKANQELRVLARQNDIKLSSSLPSSVQNSHNSIQKKSGKNFDKAFMKQMIDDHQKAIALFEKRAQNGQNEQIRMWAEKKLPTLKQHLEQAQKIYRELDK